MAIRASSQQGRARSSHPFQREKAAEPQLEASKASTLPKYLGKKIFLQVFLVFWVFFFAFLWQWFLRWLFHLEPYWRLKGNEMLTWPLLVPTLVESHVLLHHQSWLKNRVFMEGVTSTGGQDRFQLAPLFPLLSGVFLKPFLFLRRKKTSKITQKSGSKAYLPASWGLFSPPILLNTKGTWSQNEGRWRAV